MSDRIQIFSSVRWTMFSMLYRSATGFAQLLILSRILPPEQLGLLALAMSVIMTLIAISDMGLSSAVIHYQDMDHKKLSGLYWFSLLSGALLTVIVGLSSSALQNFYEAPGLANVVFILSFTFIFLAAGQQLKALAEKNLQFRKLAKIEVACNTIALAITLTFAFSGFGAMSVAIGYTTGVALMTASYWVFLSSGWWPSLTFSWKEIRKYVIFGGNMLATNLSNSIGAQADVIVFGRLFDLRSVGLYYPPRDFSMKIMMAINPIITRVGLPVIARRQNNRDEVARLYNTTILLTASINFPIYAFLALFSTQVLTITLGQQWSEAAEIMRAVAIWCMVRCLGNPIGSLLVGMGHIRRAVISSIIVTCLVIVTCIVGGLTAGAIGVPSGLCILYTLLIIPFWKFNIFPVTGTSFVDYHKQIAVPALITAASTFVAWIVSLLFTSDLGILLSGMGSGAFSYLVISFALNKRFANAMKAFLGLQK